MHVIVILLWLPILRWLFDAQFFFWFYWLRAVTATAPGYKSKTTGIWLDKAGTNVDFVLDPNVNRRGIPLRSACECRWGTRSVIWDNHLEVYLLLIVIVGFLLFLCKRRTYRRLKQRQLAGPKRPVVVWGLIFYLYGCPLFLGVRGKLHLLRRKKPEDHKKTITKKSIPLQTQRCKFAPLQRAVLKAPHFCT